MLFRNSLNGSEVNVSNLSLRDGRVFFSVRGTGCGKKFLNKWNGVLELDEHVTDGTYLRICDGWELTKQPRQRKHSEPKVASEPIVQHVASEPVAEPIAEPIVQHKAVSEPEPQAMAQPTQQQPVVQPYTQQQTANANDILGGLFQIVEQRVTENVQKMIQPALKNAVLNVQLIDTKGITHKIEGVVHEKFEVACQLVHDGFPVYFYGASGSGKNVLAEQVAKGLGLDYYYQSCVKDDFVLTGNPTASGGYCESEFYKAFSKGGLFVLDEADSIPQDVSLTLNQAIANGEFTFPVVGTVKAHKDFRIIACGNTSMGGASIEYNGRYAQDGAFKNRFAFIRVDYDTRIEEAIADHDAEILDFIRGLRKAAEDRHITLICGYRQIKGLATYRKIMKPADVIDMFVTQGMRVDELRILNEGLQDIADNQYAKAFKKMAKAA